MSLEISWINWLKVFHATNDGSITLTSKDLEEILGEIEKLEKDQLINPTE